MDLVDIDKGVAEGQVGAMAAFSATAFLPGRKIFIYAEEPIPNPDRPGLRVTTRDGTIQWNGMALRSAPSGRH